MEGMHGTLGRLSPRHRIVLLIAIAALVVPNVVLFREAFGTLLMPTTFDWWLIEEAATRPLGTMYVWGEISPLGHEYVYRYSPLVPQLMAPVLALGLGAWRLLHLAALLLLPRWLAALMLVLGPFWYDLAHGNVMTFIVVLAWHALGGKVWAQTAYFGMAMLFPRPLMLPVGAWLLWKHPQSRLPAAAVCIAGLGATAATGELPSWIAALSRGGDVIGAAFDWGPSRFLGPWWIPIGLVVGGWLTIRGRLGWASLLVSPYILPYYFLMVLLELRRFTGPSAESEDERDPRLPKLVRG